MKHLTINRKFINEAKSFCWAKQLGEKSFMLWDLKPDCLVSVILSAKSKFLVYFLSLSSPLTRQLNLHFRVMSMCPMCSQWKFPFRASVEPWCQWWQVSSISISRILIKRQWRVKYSKWRKIWLQIINYNLGSRVERKRKMATKLTYSEKHASAKQAWASSVYLAFSEKFVLTPPSFPLFLQGERSRNTTC